MKGKTLNTDLTLWVTLPSRLPQERLNQGKTLEKIKSVEVGVSWVTMLPTCHTLLFRQHTVALLNCFLFQLSIPVLLRRIPRRVASQKTRFSLVLTCATLALLLCGARPTTPSRIVARRHGAANTTVPLASSARLKSCSKAALQINLKVFVFLVLLLTRHELIYGDLNARNQPDAFERDGDLNTRNPT